MSQKKGLFPDHPLCQCVWNSSLKGENLAERLYISTFQLSHMFDCWDLPPEPGFSFWQSHASVRWFCPDFQDSYALRMNAVCERCRINGYLNQNTRISVLSVCPLTQNVLSVMDKQSWLSFLWSDYGWFEFDLFFIEGTVYFKNNIWTASTGWLWRKWITGCFKDIW